MIQIDKQTFDAGIEHFRFPLFHRIEDMSELEKLRLFPRLVSASFGGTGLDDRGLRHVAGVSTIEHLDLQNTKVSNDGLACLASLPRLRYLRLKENPQLTNDSVGHILRLTALEELQIHETSIDQSGLNRLVALPSLRHVVIDIRDNNFSFEAVLELSTRFPLCKILAKGRGEFSAGTFE